ncbi:MAG: lamin tail domain-containing protein [Pirellulales bacterium]
MERRVRWALLSLGLVSGMPWASGEACGQIVFTEVMYQPGGADALWEWVEVLNTGSSAVNLDGWVFDDDDDGALGGALGGPNIVASPTNNTMIPAGGVAVLYPGDELGFMPARFLDAWGSGINLIGVNGFTAISAGDAIGLWSSRENYNADAIGGATMSPRRTFSSAAASFSYATFDAADDGFSIAWNGTGNPTNLTNWAQSEEDLLGAFASEQTTIENAQINSTLDRGNPGLKSSGTAPAGLRITEIMFAPKSPQVTSGYQSSDFEWIEVFNNRPTPIDFAATNFVLDDVVGNILTSANVKVGVLPAGEVGILFNGAKISTEQMEQMWGAGNYIPVEHWPGLNNSGPETIGIWDSYNAYFMESANPRSFVQAVAAVTYRTQSGQGWPTTSVGNSIWLSNLSGDPNDGSNWTRADASEEFDMLSHYALPISQLAIDHPGGDVGSPGHVPGVVATLAGDYNGNGVVDAADYVWWRENDGTTGGYNTWRANYGRTLASGSAVENGSVPEPASVVLLIMAIGWLGQRARFWPCAGALPQPPSAVTRRQSKPTLR